MVERNPFSLSDTEHVMSQVSPASHTNWRDTLVQYGYVASVVAIAVALCCNIPILAIFGVGGGAVLIYFGLNRLL
jgi:hypothetical protein